MWARTWVPSPSRNRPRLAWASSHAVDAVTIGLRGNATATPLDDYAATGKWGTDPERAPGLFHDNAAFLLGR
jgi:hypothetical protein